MLSSFSLRLRNGSLYSLPMPSVMGVVNTAPNSFYNPMVDLSLALFSIENMVASGATIIDIGGEATNPYVDLQKDEPSVQQEIDRVAPLIAAVAERFDILISIDTSRPKVMQAAVEVGAQMVNDQRGLATQEAKQMAASLQVPVCIMHAFSEKREPGTCELQTLLDTIQHDLCVTVSACIDAGIDAKRIIIDPGFGQGHYRKNSRENFYLLSKLPVFVDIGYPVLVGWSRKSMIGDVLGGVPPSERLYGSVAAASVAALQGAAIIRVHDVSATVDAVKVVQAIKQFETEARTSCVNDHSI